MEKLSGMLEQEAIKFMNEASSVAKQSTCLRSKCGCVIVRDTEIIGRGFNSPPYNLESQRRCENDKKNYNKKVTDKTCCIHAEQRAMFDALKNNPEKLQDSKLYFIRLDKNDDKSFAGKPYCTICSKMALDLGIKEFTLWHESGIYSYNAEEYNNKSFEYF